MGVKGYHFIVQIRNIFVTRNTVFEKIDITPFSRFLKNISGHAEDIAPVFKSKRFCNPFSYRFKILSLLFNNRLMYKSSKLKKPVKMRFLRFFKTKQKNKLTLKVYQIKVVVKSIHYELNHNSFQMSCEFTHFTSNSEFEFKELLRENDGINVNSTQK